MEDNYLTMLCWFLAYIDVAISIHVSPPSWTSLPPHPTPLGYQRTLDLSSLHHTENFRYLILHMVMWCDLSIRPTLSFTSCAHTSVLSESPLLRCRQVPQHHLSRCHIYAQLLYWLIYFTLKDMGSYCREIHCTPLISTPDACAALSRPAPYDPMDCSPPDSSVNGLFQATIHPGLSQY